MPLHIPRSDIDSASLNLAAMLKDMIRCLFWL